MAQSVARDIPLGQLADEEGETIHGKKIPNKVNADFNIHSALVISITRTDYYRFTLV